MEPLATPADLEGRLGRSLTDIEAIRAASLLLDASGAVRRAAGGQEFTQATSVARVRVTHRIARLPQRPVTAVSSVADIRANLLLFLWEGQDRVRIGINSSNYFDVEPWWGGIQFADVTYTHGYAEIPDDLVGVTCSMVLRALGRDPIDAGLTSESIQGYSYSIGAAGAAGALGMLQSEKDIVQAYICDGGTARMDR